MAGRGGASFKKRQKEQQRRDKQQEKLARRLERKRQSPAGTADSVPDANGAESVEPQIASDSANGAPTA